MKYMLLLIGEDYDFSQIPEEQVAADMKEHEEFMAYLAQRGISWSGEALQGPTTATTLRRGKDGELVVTDGPYADLKEVIGGYYLIEARDLDEAMEVARHCPTGDGAVEVRPIFPIDEEPDGGESTGTGM